MKLKIKTPASLHRIRGLVKPFSTLLVLAVTAHAQGQGDGKAGITQATQLITGYFSVGITLMYIIGGVVGIVGAIKVYNAWSHGDQQTNKLAASWFGACIFLVVVAACLRSFFGITA